MAKEIQDVLRIEGVKARGFGVFPKSVALDSKMSIYSKAVYAYFCSLAGKGETVFPLRDTILRQLRIGRDAYYAALHELIDQGFIIIEQEESPQGSSQFRRNVYTIVARPQKYTDVTDLDEKTAKRYAEVARYGLDVHGYGIIPFIVMSDPRIKSVDKAVYAYLSALSGSRGYVDLDLRHMCYSLKFQNIQRAQRHIKNLKELNYVTAVQLHIDGRLSGGRYYLNPTPDIDAKPARVECLTPAIKKEFRQPQTDNREEEVYEEGCNLAAEQEVGFRYTGSDQHTEKEYTEKQHTEKEYTGNEYTDKEYKTTSNNSLSESNSISMMDRWIQGDTSVIAIEIQERISYPMLQRIYCKSAIEREALNDLVQAIVDAHTTDNPRINIFGEPRLTTHVCDVLDGVTNETVINVLERFLSRQGRIRPENRKPYLLSSLYREVLIPTCIEDDAD